MKKNKHLIEKVFLEVNTNSMKVANALKNNINVFIKTELLVLIEQELDLLLSDENEILQIEKLDISIDATLLQNDSINDLELKEKIKNQLSQKLEFAKKQLTANKINSENNQILSLAEKKTNTLIYYLTNGVMPWWVANNDDTIFNDQDLVSLINSENFKQQFQNILDKTIVQKRLINQFSNNQLCQIISTLTARKNRLQDNKIISNLNQENNFQLKEIFWTSVFKYLKDKNSTLIRDFYFKNVKKFELWSLPFEEFIISIKQFIPYNNNDDIAIISTTKKESEYISELQKGFYIQNAGLIIIHPFIKDLFKNCNLIKEGNTIIDKELAVHILHYVATKKEQDYEHAMVFEKFLCGIPVQQPIQREIKIDDSHKKQVEEMLQSVLQHWNALKSTSTDLLRNEFLQREGKLDIQDNNPRLFIEKKTQDLLLEKMPWNISVVKIPWIEKIIYTDW